MSTPIFNVLVPFIGNTTIQMNQAMAAAIANFILDFNDTDAEIYALAECLRDPGSYHRKATNTAFSVDAFGQQINLNLNQEMREMLKSYLNDLDNNHDEEHPNDAILRAMKYAINDPIRAYEMYVKKHSKRTEDRKYEKPNKREHQTTKEEHRPAYF